jgi:hypothetical protein
MIKRNKNKFTIEQIGGFVTIHVALPPKLLKWVVTAARKEGHRDVSLVVRRALERLTDSGSASLLLLAGV